YRPNLVLDAGDSVPFAENDWTGREIAVGTVRLTVISPTPRCAVPTLAHGPLPRRNDAVRFLPAASAGPAAGPGRRSAPPAAAGGPRS
ncbi:MAG TPA: MOSC domain-containing protein, partial [Trebonia sp.]